MVILSLSPSQIVNAGNTGSELYLDALDIQICLGSLCATPSTSSQVTCTPVSGTNMLNPFSDQGTFGIGTDNSGTADNCADSTYANDPSKQCCANYGQGDNTLFACNGWMWFAGSDSSRWACKDGKCSIGTGRPKCRYSAGYMAPCAYLPRLALMQTFPKPRSYYVLSYLKLSGQEIVVIHCLSPMSLFSVIYFILLPCVCSACSSRSTCAFAQTENGKKDYNGVVIFSSMTQFSSGLQQSVATTPNKKVSGYIQVSI